MKKSSYLKDVRNQYEDYPYPERDPEDEKKFIRATWVDSLDRINYFCHSGKKDFHADSRILVAGGGTGDSTLFLAEQLRGGSSEVVYLDFSKSSMEMARQRADIRGLDNITWIRDSLLNIPELDLGKFDHISCSGVLHHLEDPDAGLAALESALDDNGSMTIMVYGQYGRTAVYQIQELMRLVNRSARDSQEKVDNCRSTLAGLHEAHWYNHSAPADIEIPDIELYDLYLHSQDRAYTISRFYDFVEGAGLEIIKLFSYSESDTATLYDPAAYIKDKRLMNIVQVYDVRTQQAIAELLNGRISQHVCYAARTKPDSPDPACLDNIPFFTLTAPRQTYDLIYRHVCSSGDEIRLTQQTTKAMLVFRKTRNAEAIFRFMDGRRTLREIFDLVITAGKPGQGKATYKVLAKEFGEIFSAMNSHNWLLLRDRAVPEMATVQEMHMRTVFS